MDGGPRPSHYRAPSKPPPPPWARHIDAWMQREGRSQIIMATHSPILMGLPDADLRQIDRHGIGPVRLEDTSHYRLYREFILYPHETIQAMTE